ncbi:MAG: HypC/HybG/HupF family hydrogenase formation chaperone [Candidatus Dormibacteria bacterium]
MCLGIPGEVVGLDAERPGMATVDVGGARRQINVMLVEEDGVGPGDWVLIHVGFALAKIDEEEARLTLAHLEEMGQAYRDELQAISASRIE